MPSNQELLDRNELAAEDLKRGSELLPPQIMVDEKRVETGVDLIHSAKLLLGSFLRILETENVWAYSIEKHHVGKMNGLTPAFLEIEVMQKNFCTVAFFVFVGGPNFERSNGWMGLDSAATRM